MLQWLSNNLATVIICALLAAVVVGIIVGMVRKKKNGGISQAD